VPKTQLVQLALPAAAAVPAGQPAHTASIEAEHGVEGKKPAPHVVQAAQLVEPSVAAKVELTQARQAVALPAGLDVPGAQ
jgi:hypothetical protein